MTTKPDIDFSNTTFSFTFDDEVDTDKYQQAADEKIVILYNKIKTLLDNLKMNPEKPVIKWPNRLKDIEKFEKQLKEIIEG